MGLCDTAGLGIIAKLRVLWKPQKRIKNQIEKLNQGFGSKIVLLEKKTDWTDKGQNGQFTLRGDLWPNDPLKCRKLKYWKLD